MNFDSYEVNEDYEGEEMLDVDFNGNDDLAIDYFSALNYYAEMLSEEDFDNLDTEKVLNGSIKVGGIN